MEPDKNYTEAVNRVNNNMQNPVYIHHHQQIPVTNFPIGYRFVPQDDELITYYLKPRIANEPIPVPFMHDANIYLYNPKDLTDRFASFKKDEWFFFTPRDRKYPNGSRPSRAAGDGYWKATGRDKIITDDLNKIIGFRKTLVFYVGKPPEGTKSKWSMNEYRVNEPSRLKTNASDMRLDDRILCRIYLNPTKPGKKSSENETADPAVDDDQSTPDVVLEANPAVDDDQPSPPDENTTPENNNKNLEDKIISEDCVDSFFNNMPEQDCQLIDGCFDVTHNPPQSNMDIEARFDDQYEGTNLFDNHLQMMNMEHYLLPNDSEVYETWNIVGTTFDSSDLDSDLTTVDDFLNNVQSDVPRHEEKKLKM